MVKWYVCKGDRALAMCPSIVKARALAYAWIKKGRMTSLDICRHPGVDEDVTHEVSVNGNGDILYEKGDWRESVVYIYKCRPDGNLGELIEMLD